MSSGKMYQFVVTMKREARDLPWGLRLVGGSDIDTPLIITRVNPGTPAQHELVRGDIITKIDDYDARDLRHEDAQNLFRHAGNTIKLAIQRGVSNKHLYKGSFVGRSRTPTFRESMSPDASGYRVPPPMSNGSSRCSSSMLYSPLPAPYIPVANAPYSPYGGSPVSPSYRQTMQTPVQNLPQTVFPPDLPAYSVPHPYYQYNNQQPYRPLTPASTLGRKSPMIFSQFREENDEGNEDIMNQPYRTTPLVLPGAKVKKDAGPTESYLRHHPNPSMRAAPHHDHEVLMKQKVADSMLHRVVGEDVASKFSHKQFNSPLGLYSEANIVDTIKRDTNTVPYKKTVLYDPAKSETYKALQEDSLGDTIQEIPVPVQPKVFQAPTTRTGPILKKPAAQQQSQNQAKTATYVGALQDETIQQSNSFKRLMFNVLNEYTY